MVDINTLIKSESKYLAQADVPEKGKNVTIKGFREEEVNAGEGQKTRKTILYFDEFPKGLVMNLTNKISVVDATGTTETTEMKGKVVNLWNDKSVMYAGKRTGGLRIRPAVEFNDEVPF